MLPDFIRAIFWTFIKKCSRQVHVSVGGAGKKDRDKDRDKDGINRNTNRGTSRSSVDEGSESSYSLNSEELASDIYSTSHADYAADYTEGAEGGENDIYMAPGGRGRGRDDGEGEGFVTVPSKRDAKDKRGRTKSNGSNEMAGGGGTMILRDPALLRSGSRVGVITSLPGYQIVDFSLQQLEELLKELKDKSNKTKTMYDELLVLKEKESAALAINRSKYGGNSNNSNKRGKGRSGAKSAKVHYIENCEYGKESDKNIRKGITRVEKMLETLKSLQSQKSSLERRNKGLASVEKQVQSVRHYLSNSKKQLDLDTLVGTAREKLESIEGVLRTFEAQGDEEEDGDGGGGVYNEGSAIGREVDKVGVGVADRERDAGGEGPAEK